MRRRGLSLLEVIIGIGLAGVLVLSILLLATTSVQTDQKVTDRHIAAALAESQLETLARRISVEASPARAAFWSAPDGPYSGLGAPTTLTSNGTEFTLAYEISTITQPAGNDLGSAVPENRLRRVALLVTWWQGEQGRPGYGSLSVKRVSLVRESDIR